MKLEVLFAIILGTALGLVSMFTVVSLANRETTPIAQTSTNLIQEQNTSKEQITNQPKTNVSWSTATIPFSGEFKEGNFVIISSPKTDSVAPVKDNMFDSQITATEGLNSYFVYKPSGALINKVELFSLKQIPEGKNIHQGTVTDITQDGLQMREANGTITQAKYSKNVEFISILKDYKKITQTDVAIGDHIVALEELVEKGITLTDHIIIIQPDKPLFQSQLISAPLKAFTRNTITLTVDNAEKTINTTTSTKFYGIKEDGYTRNRTKLINSDLETTIYAVITDLTNSTARSIFILEK